MKQHKYGDVPSPPKSGVHPWHDAGKVTKGQLRDFHARGETAEFLAGLSRADRRHAIRLFEAAGIAIEDADS